MINEIIFIHEGKANYPEIPAYKEYFADKYAIKELQSGDLNPKNDCSHSVLWYLMGFYPKKINAAFIIHDYRSLSVGKYGWLKDKIKRNFNHKPKLTHVSRRCNA